MNERSRRRKAALLLLSCCCAAPTATRAATATARSVLNAVDEMLGLGRGVIWCMVGFDADAQTPVSLEMSRSLSLFEGVSTRVGLTQPHSLLPHRSWATVDRPTHAHLWTEAQNGPSQDDAPCF